MTRLARQTRMSPTEVSPVVAPKTRPNRTTPDGQALGQYQRRRATGQQGREQPGPGRGARQADTGRSGLDRCSSRSGPPSGRGGGGVVRHLPDGPGLAAGPLADREARAAVGILVGAGRTGLRRGTARGFQKISRASSEVL